MYKIGVRQYLNVPYPEKDLANLHERKLDRLRLDLT